MRKSSMLKTACLVLCAVILAYAFLSMHLAATHVTHTCVTEHCTVCAIIHSARSLLRQLTLLLSALLFTVALSIRVFHAEGSPYRQKAQSLITLKIRLNP